MHFPPAALVRPSTLGILLSAAAIITVSAKIQIPFWPVPMTLHTMAILTIAAAAGPRIGLAATAVYLGAGVMGLPVFSGSPARGTGLVYMVGPTGGYLLGYLIAAWLVGVLAKGRGPAGRALAMLAGLLPVYAFGLAWLSVYVPQSQLLAAGLTPFLLGDVVKVGLGGLMLAGLERLLRGKAQ